MNSIVSQIGGTDSIFSAEKFRALCLSQKSKYGCLYIQISSDKIKRKDVDDSTKFSVRMRVHN